MASGSLTPRSPSPGGSFRGRASDLLEALSLPSQSVFAPLSADAPTITVQQNTPTLTERVVGPHTGEVTPVGSRSTWSSTNNRLPALGQAGLDFYYTGLACEIGILTGVNNVNLPCWVFVDGLPVTAAPDTTSIGTVVGPDEYYVKLTWGTAKRRRVEFFCAHNGSWFDVRGSYTDSFAPGPVKPKVAFIGDSFYAGASAFFQSLGGAHFIASRLLGVECLTYADSGLLVFGGTGYSTVGSGTVFGDATRVSSVETIDPDLVVFQGSVNDDSVHASVAAAAALAYADFADAVPNTPFIVLGPQPTSATGTLSANRQSNIAAVKSAAVANAHVIGFHDQVGTAAAVPSAYQDQDPYLEGGLATYKGSVWAYSNAGTSGNSTLPPGQSAKWKLKTWATYGTGRVGTTTSDGNRDILLASDGTHPTATAQSIWGAMTAQKIRADLAAYVADGTVTSD